MNNEKLVSIIIPMYNAKRTIMRTIHSITSQSYKNMEIIVINDGSSDGSESIVNQCIREDNRITLYSIENSGVSCARNYGIACSSGEYVIFVDSDDAFKFDTVEQLMASSQETDTDLTASEIIDTNGTSTNKNEYMDHPFVSYDNSTIGENLYYIRMECACGKLYKRSVIVQNNIHFPEGFQLFEDFIFVNRYVQCSKSVSKNPQAHYLVNNVNEASLSKRYIENVDYVVKSGVAEVKETFRVFPTYKEVYYRTNMSLDFQPCIKFVNNLFLVGAPKIKKYRVAYQYLICEKNIDCFTNQVPKEEMPKRRVDWMYYYAFKTRNISIIFALFWVKEKIKRLHNAYQQ